MSAEHLTLRRLDRGDGGELRILLAPDGKRTVTISDPAGSVVVYAPELLDVARTLLALVKGYGSPKRARSKGRTATSEATR